MILLFFFFNDTATTEIYTLSLHDALPISFASALDAFAEVEDQVGAARHLEPAHVVSHRDLADLVAGAHSAEDRADLDRKSTRLNSSHSQISYAVFCLKKQNSTQLQRKHND